jgi:ribonuclease J
MSVVDDGAEDFTAGDGELLFVPLGGSGEIGMNLNLFGCAGRWLMVDLGIGFSGDELPGVDIMVPDVSFIAERRDRLDGLVLTHAHEDHLGAVPYLWPRLRCPVYATPFAAAVLRRKLIEAGLDGEVPLHEVAPGRRFTLGPFGIEYIGAAHSIPEAHVVAVRTPVGTIAHATDWKLDPAPLIGDPTDEAALRSLGEEDILAMTCDSTNAMVPGRAGSEAALRDSLIELVGRCERRVAVACFSSNVARLETIAVAAERNDRQVCVVGRSMVRMLEAARETGYLANSPPFLTEYDIGYLPPEKVVLAVTGSQGEPRSALSRIAAGDHSSATLEAGDVVIFSSRAIPGNEISIGRLRNQLARLGVEAIAESDHFVHVSGHPAQDELADMHRWIRPRTLIPIHGETQHLFEHVSQAERNGIPHTVIGENGSVIRLAPGTPEVVGHVTAGRFAVDGGRLLPIDGTVMRARKRIQIAGAAVATVVLNGTGRLLAEPRLTVQGLADEDDRAMDDAIEAIVDVLDRMSDKDLQDDDEVEEAVRIAVRRSFRESVGKRPLTKVHLMRL